jgi:hypothetical protein
MRAYIEVHYYRLLQNLNLHTIRNNIRILTLAMYISSRETSVQFKQSESTNQNAKIQNLYQYGTLK